MNSVEKKRRYYEILESPTQGKEFLHSLEKEQKYLFHGSDVDVPTLEPSQAVDAERGPDGVPAVFASSRIDFAIFHAIISKTNCPDGFHGHTGEVAHDDGTSTVNFSANQTTVDQLTQDSSGWVYVFEKSEFLQRNGKGSEYVSEKSVKPIHKIRVKRVDLPRDIEIV